MPAASRFRKTLPIFRPLHARHRIDAGWGDALWALGASVRRTVPVRNDALVSLSVRSAWDLVLTALDLPPGEEVLVTAITHPDMARIAGLHGLRVVPVDVDPGTLAPVGLVATPRARILLIAHLFGARVDLDAAAAFARRHGLLLVEDCAQALRTASDSGDSGADVSLFSFGFLKTATALGGALAWVRDGELRARMAEIHDGWPLQRRRSYAAKAMKCLLALAVSRPGVYGAVSRVTDVGALVRTIPAGDDAALVGWIRRRPCAGLVATIDRRLQRFPAERVRRRTATGDELAAALPPGLFHPGGASSHWLFPVVTADPDKLVVRLREAGFDASRGTSQIAALAPAPCAEALMAGMVFLPAYPELPAAERRRLIETLRACV